MLCQVAQGSSGLQDPQPPPGAVRRVALLVGFVVDEVEHHQVWAVIERCGRFFSGFR